MPEILPGTGGAEEIAPDVAAGARRFRRIILVVLLLIGLLGVGLGVLWIRDGSWTPQWGARNVAVCPTQLMAPAPPEQTHVNVYNAGARNGMATEAGGKLTARGFAVGRVDNATLDGGTPERPGVILTGPSAVSQALAVQRQVRDSVVVMQAQRTDGTVDLYLGTAFHGVVAHENINNGPGRLRCSRGVFVTPGS